MNTRKRMKRRRKPSSILPSVIIGIVCLAIAMGIVFIPKHLMTTASSELSEYASVNVICELATLKSFYHNVAMYEAKPTGSDKFINDVMLWPFGSLVKTGYKQFWLEYSGVVETGIDASQVQINAPNNKGVVDVYVPDAKVLNVFADEKSLSEPISEKGMFTKITGEEQARAFAMAQSAMREEAENDQSLLTRAKSNAKQLLEQYIIKTGKLVGVDYTVNWIDSPM